MTVLYVVTLKYIKPIKDIEEHLPAHIEWLSKCYDEGHFVMSGRKVPRNGGVIIAKAKSLLELSDLLNTDPFQIHKLATTEIIVFEASMISVENLLA